MKAHDTSRPLESLYISYTIQPPLSNGLLSASYVSGLLSLAHNDLLQILDIQDTLPITEGLPFSRHLPQQISNSLVGEQNQLFLKQVSLSILLTYDLLVRGKYFNYMDSICSYLPSPAYNILLG